MKKTRSRIRMYTVLMLSFISCTRAVSIPTNGGSVAVIGGTSSFAEGSGVVWIKEAGDSSCTGVIIGDRHILTAAHCVVGISNGFLTGIARSEFQLNGKISLSNNSTIDLNTQLFVIDVVTTEVNPAWKTACPGAVTCGPYTDPYPPDLAIIILKQSLPPSWGVDQRPRSSQAGNIVMSGYGCDTSINVTPTFPFRFRTAKGVIDSPNLINIPINTWVSNVSAFAQNYMVVAGPGNGGIASLCPGDSGGPLVKGTWPSRRFVGGLTVVAINSFVTNSPQRDVADTNAFARLDTVGVDQWIKVVFNRNQLVGTTPGVDPRTHTDYCAAAAIMCTIGRLPEYRLNTQRCAGLDGLPPACEFPDAQPFCDKAAQACMNRDDIAWTAFATQCDQLGGTLPPCTLPYHIQPPILPD